MLALAGREAFSSPALHLLLLEEQRSITQGWAYCGAGRAFIQHMHGAWGPEGRPGQRLGCDEVWEKWERWRDRERRGWRERARERETEREGDNEEGRIMCPLACCAPAHRHRRREEEEGEREARRGRERCALANPASPTQLHQRGPAKLEWGN